MSIKVGTIVKSDKYGTGECKQIDKKSNDFRYFFKFINPKKYKKRKDITLIWTDKKTAKEFEVISE